MQPVQRRRHMPYSSSCHASDQPCHGEDSRRFNIQALHRSHGIHRSEREVGRAGLPSSRTASSNPGTNVLGRGIGSGDTGCKANEFNTVASAVFKLKNCVMAQQFIRCLDDHRVVTPTELQSVPIGLQTPQHESTARLPQRSEALRYFFGSCNQPLWEERGTTQRRCTPCSQVMTLVRVDRRGWLTLGQDFGTSGTSDARRTPSSPTQLPQTNLEIITSDNRVH